MAIAIDFALSYQQTSLILMLYQPAFTYSITLSYVLIFFVEVHTVLKTHIIIRDLNKISAKSKILKTPQRQNRSHFICTD